MQLFGVKFHVTFGSSHLIGLTSLEVSNENQFSSLAGMDWTRVSYALSYFTDSLVLSLAVTGSLIGGIIITLLAGYLIMKR